MGLLLDGAGTLARENTERAKVLHAFFISVFTGETGLQESQAPKTRGKVWSKEDLPLVQESQVREHVKKNGHT